MPTSLPCLGTAPDSPWPLVYLHVMKSGGLSVDAMLRCRPRAFGAAGSGCKVPSGSSAVNPTSVALKRWHVAPLEAEAAPESDAATRRAILGRNRLDAELYEHAKRLSSKS